MPMAASAKNGLAVILETRRNTSVLRETSHPLKWASS
jgi:hypothetical protein